MVMKSLKGKIAAGVIVTGLVAGMGSVFASTDAGAQFGSWYSSVFNKSTTKITTDVAITYGSKIGQYSNEYAQLKAASEKKIEDAQLAKKNSTMATINTQKNTYTDQVNNAAAKLNVEGDFAKFTEDTKTAINALKASAKTIGESGLKTSLDKQGKVSVEAIEKDVAAFKASSTKYLNEVITNAKATVNGKVDTNAAASKAAITAHIEAKIVELRNELTAYAATLVAEKQAAIELAGNNATTDALAALDGIVNAINK